MSASFPVDMLVKLIPEMVLFALAALILVLDLIFKKRTGQLIGWLTVAGTLSAAGLGFAFAMPGAAPEFLFGGMLRLDAASFVFRMIFLIGAALTALYSIDTERLAGQGEYFALLVVSTLGMCLLASSSNLIMLFLAIELVAIPLYVLAGFNIKDERSVEGGIKYLLFGMMTSAVMLFGFSLLYGLAGTVNIPGLAEALASGKVPAGLVIGIMLLVMVGFFFKISAAPFHFWAPDVYEGAPTPVAGFLSTASKAAGMIALLRVLLEIFPAQAGAWNIIVAVGAVASMLLGNLLALAQKNIKRLLAYSSIAQAGYILIGVASGSILGVNGAVYYLMAYLLTNLAAFGVVWVVSRTTGSDEIQSFSGLSRRSPGLAILLSMALLSLGGIPLFAGFLGKFLVFASAIQSGMIWLAVIGVLNSVVALYYYLNVMKVMYLGAAPDGEQAVKILLPWRMALWFCGIGILVLGVIFSPWYNWSALASTAIFLH
ncbi:MAG: NADH-quinone oxidoreductase subunit N [Anaerolineaceae bacterium]|nr:NADH-quinone oxidoreductase subunit N [Anaerolineaceae bacterium]